jgi:hypothetical protein
MAQFLGRVTKALEAANSTVITLLSHAVPISIGQIFPKIVVA